MRARLAILLSGTGSTYANLQTWIADGRLDAEICGVIASRPGVGGLSHAERFGHPARVARERTAIAEILTAWAPDCVAMCGWMRYWDPPPPFADKVVNIHPALLPSPFGGTGMYGIHVHRAVLAAGCRVSGCTAHLVRGAYDTGPILAQRAVPVHHDDQPEDLAARVQASERDIYPRVIAGLLSGRLRRDGERYWIDGLDDEVPPIP